MATWVYKCESCGKTFAKEVPAGQQPAEASECPHCGASDASKSFEIPASGGCGCGGNCC